MNEELKIKGPKINLEVHKDKDYWKNKDSDINNDIWFG